MYSLLFILDHSDKYVHTLRKIEKLVDTKWLFLVFCVISETVSYPGETDSQTNGMRLNIRFDKNKNWLFTGM